MFLSIFFFRVENIKKALSLMRELPNSRAKRLLQDWLPPTGIRSVLPRPNTPSDPVGSGED